MKILSAFLLLATFSFHTVRADDGSDWLMKINSAARDLNYAGTFVFVENKRVETMRVIHATRAGVMRQRLYALNGEPREVIRDAEQIWCYVPDKKLGVHEYRQVSKQGFPNLLPQDLEHVSQYYDLQPGRIGRVAGRQVQQIMIVPKDPYRYGYDLWADISTGLLLKAVLLNSAQEPLEQYLFVEVDIGGDISDEELNPMTPANELVWYGDAKGDASNNNQTGDMPESNWVVENLPDGFILSRKIKRLSPMREKMIEHYVYSDGLASVSVFVEQIDDESKMRVQGINKMGAVHAFGREIEGHQVTVVGEVPAQTVDLIGMSVKQNL